MDFHGLSEFGVYHSDDVIVISIVLESLMVHRYNHVLLPYDIEKCDWLCCCYYVLMSSFNNYFCQYSIITFIFRLLPLITLHSPTLQSPQLSKYHHPGRSQGPPWEDSELSVSCESLGVAIRASCGILATIFDNVVILLGKLLWFFGKLPWFIWINHGLPHCSCATGKKSYCKLPQFG